MLEYPPPCVPPGLREPPSHLLSFVCYQHVRPMMGWSGRGSQVVAGSLLPGPLGTDRGDPPRRSMMGGPQGVPGAAIIGEEV